MKFSPSIDITKGYIVLKLGGNRPPRFWEQGGQSSKFGQLYLRNGSIWGSKFFCSSRGPRVY